MDDKFTAGPWTQLPAEVDKDYIRIRGTRLGGRYKIANVCSPTYEGMSALEAFEPLANARLIAAAPDLLDALRDCLAFIERDMPTLASSGPERMAALEAITKATGAKP